MQLEGSYAVSSSSECSVASFFQLVSWLRLRAAHAGGGKATGAPTAVPVLRGPTGDRRSARRAGRGRPKRRWRLAEATRGRFPDTHAELAVDLIEAARAELGDGALDRLIARRERATVERYGKALAACRRLDLKVAKLAELRSAEGYMAEMKPAEDGRDYLLIENHCPICAAARACQGFCRAELEVFQMALGPGATIERSEHLLAGARCCSYRITPRHRSAARGVA